MTTPPRIEGTPDPRHLGKLEEHESTNPEEFKKILRVSKSDEADQGKKKRQSKTEEGEPEESHESEDLHTPQTVFSEFMADKKKSSSVFDPKKGSGITLTAEKDTKPAEESSASSRYSGEDLLNRPSRVTGESIETLSVESTKRNKPSFLETHETEKDSKDSLPEDESSKKEGVPSFKETKLAKEAPAEKSEKVAKESPPTNDVLLEKPTKVSEESTSESLSVEATKRKKPSFLETHETEKDSKDSLPEDESSKKEGIPSFKETKLAKEAPTEKSEKVAKEAPPTNDVLLEKPTKVGEESTSEALAVEATKRKKPSFLETHETEKDSKDSLPKDESSKKVAVPSFKETKAVKESSTPSNASSPEKKKTLPLETPPAKGETPEPIQTQKEESISSEDANEGRKDTESNAKKGTKEAEETLQVSPDLSPNILPIGIPPIETPVYATLSSDAFDLFEQMVGLITIEQSNKGVSVTTIKLAMPGSIFHGCEIKLEHYDTAPHSFNVQLLGTPDAVQNFSANLSRLTASFEQAKYSFSINLQTPILLKEEQPLFKRKGGIDNQMGDSSDQRS